MFLQNTEGYFPPHNVLQTLYRFSVVLLQCFAKGYFFITEDHLIAAFQDLKRAYKKAEEGPFIRADGDRAKGNGFKLEKDRFRLDVKNKLFTVRVVRHWKTLPSEAVDAPSLEALKARLDGAARMLV